MPDETEETEVSEGDDCQEEISATQGEVIIYLYSYFNKIQDINST